MSEAQFNSDCQRYPDRSRVATVATPRHGCRAPPVEFAHPSRDGGYGSLKNIPASVRHRRCVVGLDGQAAYPCKDVERNSPPSGVEGAAR
jgi:hypothetical protein